MLEPFWTAVVFLVLGLLLIVGEVTAPGFFVAVPGGALVVMGSIGLLAPHLMFDSPWSWALWPVAAVLSTTVNLYLYKRWAPPGRKPLTLTSDSLPGETGAAESDVGPAGGTVRIKGGTWSARSAAAIPAGAAVRVVRVEGVTVVVEPA